MMKIMGGVSKESQLLYERVRERERKVSRKKTKMNKRERENPFHTHTLENE